MDGIVFYGGQNILPPNSPEPIPNILPPNSPEPIQNILLPNSPADPQPPRVRRYPLTVEERFRAKNRQLKVLRNQVRRLRMSQVICRQKLKHIFSFNTSKSIEATN